MTSADRNEHHPKKQNEPRVTDSWTQVSNSLSSITSSWVELNPLVRSTQLNSRQEWVVLKSAHCNQGTSWSLSCAAVLAAVLFARQGQHTFKLFQSLTLILSRTYTHTYANKVEMTYFSWWLIYEISIWYQTIEYYDAHVTCRGAWLSHSANLSRQQAVSVSFLFISPDFSCQQ